MCFICKVIMGKVLLINDVHVGHSSILEFNANWKEAVDICVKRGITELIVGGDLYQSRSSQTLDVLLAVRAFLLYARDKGVYVTLANGNHDLVNQDAFEGYCHVFSHYPDVFVIDDFAAYDVSDTVTIHTVAYFPETGKFLDIYKELLATIDKNKTNILYIHAGINGALAHPSEKDLPANMFGDFDKVLVGHYHDRCHIEGTNVHYIGSSRQFNFGEDEAKGYTIVHEDGSIEYIDNQANMRYTTVETSFRKWNHPDTIKKLNEYRDGGRYKVRLRINCKQEEASSVNKKALLEAGANKVEIVVTDMKVIEAKTSSLFQKFDTKQLVNTYSEFCEEKGITDASIGVDYLSKINRECGD